MNLSETDRATLHALLKSRFELTDELTAELIDAAVAAEHDAVDFYHFTHTLMRALDEPGRQRMVEMMWQLVYADHQVTEFEDNVMWRIADLLGVSARQRIELKERRCGRSRGPEIAPVGTKFGIKVLRKMPVEKASLKDYE